MGKVRGGSEMGGLFGGNISRRSFILLLLLSLALSDSLSVSAHS